MNNVTHHRGRLSQFGLLAALIFLFSVNLQATTWYVSTTGSDDQTGTSWTEAFRTPQKALQVAEAGDDIWVAAGTYYPDEGPGIVNDDQHASFHLKAGVGLYGGFAGTETAPAQRDLEANLTVLSGDLGMPGLRNDNSLNIVVASQADEDSRLDGFTIEQSWNGLGGGLLNDGGTLLIANCHFYDNRNVYGGAVYSYSGGELIVTNSLFTKNEGGLPGAIHSSQADVTLDNCTFQDNTGGLYIEYGSAMVNNCSFIENHTFEAGAIENWIEGTVVLTNCFFSGNTAVSQGGAIRNLGLRLEAYDCVFTGNSSGGPGGAIANPFAELVLVNCTFFDNSSEQFGGALYHFSSDGTSTVTNCTFAKNSAPIAGGIYHDSGDDDLLLTNTILWDNPGGEIVNARAGSAITNFSIIQGGYPGTGNLDRDPDFADLEGGDLHIMDCSAAIDAGTAAGAPAEDVEGDARPFGAAYDIGIDEFTGMRTLPIAQCRDLTVQLDADGQATLDAAQFDEGSTGCAPLSFTVDGNSTLMLGCEQAGVNHLTVTVTDYNELTTSCSVQLTVEDPLAPTVECSGGAVTFNGEAGLSVVDVLTVQPTDACGIATVDYAPEVISCDMVGQQVPVIVSVTDVNGNIGRCTTSVQVNGLPCGFIDPGGIGCSSQAGYDPATGTFSIQTDDCNSGSPYNDEWGAIAYRLCGNGSISFRLASLSSQNAFAGIFLRTGPQPNAVKAEVVTNRYFTARGVVREYAGAAAWPLPFYLYGRHWLKLERLGNQVRIYTSTNGQSWTILLARNLTLPICVYVGMMAYGPGAVTATFDDVKVNGSPLQTGPLQTSPEGGGFPLEEAFLKPSTVHRLLSTVLPTSDFPLPTPTLSGTGLPPVASKPSTVQRLPLTLYPNPTSGPLTVELPIDLLLDGANLDVLDGYGRSVLRKTGLNYQQRLDLCHLPSGAYFVRLQTADGERWLERVVVQPRP